MKTYSLSEIKKHNKIYDCWVIANNKVYNVTKLIKYHPGGVESIIKYAGTDCSEHFKFHNKLAKKKWNKYHIGYTKEFNQCIIL